MRFKDFCLFATSLVVASAFGLAAPSEAENLSDQQVLKTADHQKGIPYSFGGATPTGFDCSGLVQFVYARANIQLPRTADAQFAFGTPVTLAQAQPGDLMFFNTDPKATHAVTHVGIFMGGESMLHAPRPGKRVQYASVGARSWFRPRLLGIRRVAREAYEIARKPHGWERTALPNGVAIAVSPNYGRPVLIDRLRERPLNTGDTQIASSRYF